MNTSRHLKNTELKNNENLVVGTQTAIEFQNIFFADLARLFISLDMPFHKINHPALKEFIGKYLKKVTPDESTLRTQYLPKLFNMVHFY